MLTFVRRGWFLSLRCSFFGIFKQKTKYHDLHALRCYFQIQQFQKPSFQVFVLFVLHEHHQRYQHNNKQKQQNKIHLKYF
jgi:hypothetical protein